MVEIFKTNVQNTTQAERISNLFKEHFQAQRISNLIKEHFSEARINFDLVSDKILKEEGIKKSCSKNHCKRFR